MTAFNSTTSVKPAKIKQILKTDPYISAIYQANNLADLDAIIDLFGITDPQHRAAMLGMAKLNWVLIRKLEKIL